MYSDEAMLRIGLKIAVKISAHRYEFKPIICSIFCGLNPRPLLGFVFQTENLAGCDTAYELQASLDVLFKQSAHVEQK